MEEIEKNGRGGARPGSGRKRGKKLGPYKSPDQLRVQRQFSIRPEVSRELDEIVEPGERSRFVNEAIRKYLGELKRSSTKTFDNHFILH